MHVFNTWLIANIIHPVLMAIPVLLNEYSRVTGDTIVIGVVFFMVSTVCSVPCLFAANGVMWVVKRLPFDRVGKFVVWVLLCSMLPTICFSLVILITHRELFLPDVIASTLPAAGAVFITILLRFKPFFLYINQPIEANLQSN
jgi:hypothetical protein